MYIHAGLSEVKHRIIDTLLWNPLRGFRRVDFVRAGISKAAFSKHIKEMAQQKAVLATKSGRGVIWKLNLECSILRYLVRPVITIGEFKVPLESYQRKYIFDLSQKNLANIYTDLGALGAILSRYADLQDLKNIERIASNLKEKTDKLGKEILDAESVDKQLLYQHAVVSGLAHILTGFLKPDYSIVLYQMSSLQTPIDPIKSLMKPHKTIQRELPQDLQEIIDEIASVMRLHDPSEDIVFLRDGLIDLYPLLELRGVKESDSVTGYYDATLSLLNRLLKT